MNHLFRAVEYRPYDAIEHRCSEGKNACLEKRKPDFRNKPRYP